MKSFTRVSILAIGLLTPLFASAANWALGADSGGNWALSVGSGNAGCTATICGVANTLLYLINAVAVPLLFAVAFIVFLWGVAQAYIFSHGDSEKVSQGHRLILWGLIGFAVMVSLWGLVNIVTNTFGLSGYAAPALPQSYFN